MMSAALSLFMLRKLPFSRFKFAGWQTVLAITLIGVLAGLDPNLRYAEGFADLSLWISIAMTVFGVWAFFLVTCAVLRWWLKRGGRWDGQGNLLNLLAAASLVTDVLGASFTLLGIPMLLSLPLWLYSVWIAGKALSCCIPRASLGYCIGGIVISMFPVMLAVGLFTALLGSGNCHEKPYRYSQAGGAAGVHSVVPDVSGSRGYSGCRTL